MFPLKGKEEHNVKQPQQRKIGPFILSIGLISQCLKNTLVVFIKDTSTCSSQSVGGCGMVCGYLMVLVL